MLEIKIDTSQFKVPKNISAKDLEVLLRRVAARVRAAMVEATPYDSGTTRDAWTTVKKDEGGVSFGNPLAQASALQYGSIVGKRPWPNPGTRTVYNEEKGRIFSSQAPSGITDKANVNTVAQEAAEEIFEAILDKMGST